jgi:hypothetical protein
MDWCFREPSHLHSKKKVVELLGGEHQLSAVIEPLLAIHEQVCQQQGTLDNQVR